MKKEEATETAEHTEMHTSTDSALVTCKSVSNRKQTKIAPMLKRCIFFLGELCSISQVSSFLVYCVLYYCIHQELD